MESPFLSMDLQIRVQQGPGAPRGRGQARQSVHVKEVSKTLISNATKLNYMPKLSLLQKSQTNFKWGKKSA